MPDTTAANEPTTEPNAPLPSAFSLLRPSWQAIKLNFFTLFGLFVIPFVLTVIIDWLSVSGHSTTWRLMWLRLIPTILSFIFAPGITYTALQGAKGHKVDFNSAFNTGLHFFWRLLGVTILSAIIIIVGFICLIVPGIFMLRRYYLAPYYLLDRDLGVIETLKVCGQESKRFTAPILYVFCVQLLFGLIFIIPILGWIAGAILTVMYYNAPAIRYLEIKRLVKPRKDHSQNSA